MDDYLSKPVNPAALLSKLAEFEERGGAAKTQSGTAPAQEPALNELLETAGIESAALETLDSVMTPEESREFVEAFCAELESRMSRMVEAETAEALAADAHALIGTAGNVGAMQVSALAGSIEKSCKTGDFTSAQATMAVLRQTADKASEGLEAWLRAKPTGSPKSVRAGRL
jgi:HPt (histidine-containing phosphotransfer) domain-containing protein